MRSVRPKAKWKPQVLPKNRVRIIFPAPIAGLDRLFDQVAIMSAKSPQKEMAVLGPYYVGVNKAGSYLILKRNPNYWEKDPAGRPLPYIESIRLDIQQNRDIEMLRLTRGEIHFINSLDAEYFDKVVAQNPSHGARCRRLTGFRRDRGSIKSPTLRSRPTRRRGSLRRTSGGRFRKPSTAKISRGLYFVDMRVPQSGRFLQPTSSGSTPNCRRIPLIRNPRYSVWLRMDSAFRIMSCAIAMDTLSSSPSSPMPGTSTASAWRP